MKRIFVGAVLVLGLTLPANADVTLKQTTGGKGLGISGTASATTYIKGNRMRSDVVMGDKTQTTIFDVVAQKMYVFDSKKKEADVWDMATFGAELSKTVDMSGAKASVKPNGQTKQIAGRTAAPVENGQRDDDFHCRLRGRRAADRRPVCAAGRLQTESEEVRGGCLRPAHTAAPIRRRVVRQAGGANALVRQDGPVRIIRGFAFTPITV